MIVYFTDRKMNVLGQASTNLPEGIMIIDDNKIEDIDSGVASFECEIAYNKDTRNDVEKCCQVGNYILIKNDNENEFYTIIDFEQDTKKQKIYIYAEDAGLDLLNEVVGPYAADKAYNIAYYVNKFAYDSGFVIKINEVPNLTRKLSWDGEATASERIRSVATQFDGCEISYSFDIKNLQITNKYINIYKKRGKDQGVQLRLNREVDRIITKKSIANLATALEVIGGTPENAENPITLNGYKYDDGDFYVSGNRLYSRKALQTWSRYIWANEPNQIENVGHIVKRYSYDTTSQSELCNRAISELKKIREIEINYEVDISQFPKNTKIGDRVNIIDDEGSLYLSTRFLKLEQSITNQEYTATLGEYLIKDSGISQKVIDLANQFAQQSQSAQRALEIANAAKEQADQAKSQADNALSESQNAQNVANDAKDIAGKATQSAQEATNKANEMQQAVDGVLKSVESLETSISNAQQAADNAYKAAETAKKDAETAKQQATEAVENANTAKEQATTAGTKADSAITKADDAVATAGTAKTEAANASATAAAAKADAVQAQKDVDALGSNLETLKTTMQTDYARKTDLTETESKLQTQITQNADSITQTASKVTKIDETANNAKEIADKASADALSAQTKADAASADATAAQSAADKAKEAATAAQTNADNAKAAADNAQSVASKAETDLANAKKDLETVQGRVDVTEQDILAAQAKVDAAQQAADKAKTDAANAITNATNAQNIANQASENATAAQNKADEAATNATLAQKTADEAKGDAAAAALKADQAAQTAANAQSTADTAKQNATNAQQVADKAVADALAAQTAANNADSKAQQATVDLEKAKENLSKVEGDLSSTKEEVEAAKSAVVNAQVAADKAKADAIAAQQSADTAKKNAEQAQTDATNAKNAADKAQAEAEAAKQAADKAQADADALAVRVTSAETSIKQNSDKIALAATKDEVKQTLGGYYTKKETDSKIQVESNKISQTVTEKVNGIQVGGRNLAINTNKGVSGWGMTRNDGSYKTEEEGMLGVNGVVINIPDVATKWSVLFYRKLALNKLIPSTIYTVSFDIHSSVDLPTFDAEIKDTSGLNIVASHITSTSPVKADTWTSVSCQMRTAGILPEIKDQVLYLTHAFNKISIIKICNLKLEVGNKATDWSPAPEDMVTNEDFDAGMDGLNSSINETKSSIEQLADQITHLIVDENGSSMMTQDENGWHFDMSSITGNIDAVKKELSDAQIDHEATEKLVNGIQSTVNEVNKKTAYIDIDSDAEGRPVMTLGSSESNFKVVITNESIDFMEGSNRVAYASNNRFYAPQMVTVNSIQIGEAPGFKWEMRKSGNMGLVYVSK